MKVSPGRAAMKVSLRGDPAAATASSSGRAIRLAQAGRTLLSRGRQGRVARLFHRGPPDVTSPSPSRRGHFLSRQRSERGLLPVVAHARSRGEIRRHPATAFCFFWGWRSYSLIRRTIWRNGAMPSSQNSGACISMPFSARSARGLREPPLAKIASTSALKSRFSCQRW